MCRLYDFLCLDMGTIPQALSALGGMWGEPRRWAWSLVHGEQTLNAGNPFFLQTSL